MNEKLLSTKNLVDVLHPAKIGTSMVMAVAGATSLDAFAFSAIPATGSEGADRDGHVRLHAKQSRLRIQSETNLSNGDSLKTHLEGDFYGSGGNETFSNSTGLRLRHAYATFGRWTIGQTWTNFMDMVAYPSTVDFYGPVGKSFARQGQIRYTLPNGLAFSLENPGDRWRRCSGAFA